MNNPLEQNAANRIEHAESVRVKDPNVSQNNASNPASSVFVSANAGTGKTKVLTDRVLRLLLPRASGMEGTEPHRILCLTYTKAAANEMALRLNKTLGEWAVIQTEELREDLKALLGTAPTTEQEMQARKLFARVIDTPGGLKIMTIHSFCQSILGRFPLEAGLPPYFDMMEETQAHELMRQAQSAVLQEARQKPASEIGKALQVIATLQNEKQFTDLLSSLCGERGQMRAWISREDDDILYRIFNLPVGLTQAKLIRDFAAATPCDALYEAIRALHTGTKTDIEKAEAIQSWLEGDIGDDIDAFHVYKRGFLKSDNLPYAKPANKSVSDNHPQVIDVLLQETQRVLTMLDTLNALNCITYSTYLLALGTAILKHYETIKHKRALVDFDDLILKTRDLLKRSKDSAQWVLYKLDGGLSHILIDEAQDTNPEQWEIIDCLSDDFFEGESAADEDRTLFIVGDEKQSIYSFQRAAPQLFQKMRHHFKTKVESGDKTWTDESMVISFRSTRTVLEHVDEVFIDPVAGEGLGEDDILHRSFRTGQAGLVELWPPFTDKKAEEEEPWSPPVTIQEQKSGSSQLAEFIGNTIKNWVERGEELESYSRPIRPGDIMILVRTRTAFVGQLMRSLKTLGIPVSGADRMVLGDEIAIKDLLSVIQFCLLPEDDLTLATILKSPLIGIDENTLYDLAVDRDGTLWDTLRQSTMHKNAAEYLQDLITLACESQPYDFLTYILQSSCPADAKSGLRAITRRLGQDAHDPIDELLNCALNFGQENIPTLQGFVSEILNNPVTIKRELEEAGNEVRIMTVHGSKGLQAPVVILPDTFMTSAGNSLKRPRLLWPDKSELEAPLFMPTSDGAPTAYLEARQHVQDKMDEEHRRLLYVAMTRAEDRLYIGGYKGLARPRDDSWYHYIERAFAARQDAEPFELRPATDDEEAKTGLRIHHPATRDPDRAKHNEEKQAQTDNHTAPTWLFKRAPEEPDPPRPLIPSRPSIPEPAAQSPLSKDDPYRFKRGNITHMLLQMLPDLPAGRRRKAAQTYLAKPAHELSDKMQGSILRETFAILEDPEFASLFGAGSMAEVPLTGLMNGRIISAQIDRLLVTAERIAIVDYKTNRPPPSDPADIPDIYINQMSSYKDIVANIYDCAKIDCYLLWTDGPHMMKVPLD